MIYLPFNKSEWETLKNVLYDKDKDTLYNMILDKVYHKIEDITILNSEVIK